MPVPPAAVIAAEKESTQQSVPRHGKGAFSSSGKEPKEGGKSRSEEGRGLLTRTQSSRRFAILFHSVTMMEMCLDACILWISSALER